MNRILAIDPGRDVSAWVITEHINPVEIGISLNEIMLNHLRNSNIVNGVECEMVIEKPVCMRRSGKDVTDTIIWAGRFIQMWPMSYTMFTRQKVRGLLGCKGGDLDMRKMLVQEFDSQAIKTLKNGKLIIKKDELAFFSGFDWVDKSSKKVKYDIWQAYALVLTLLKSRGEVWQCPKDSYPEA